MPTLTPRELFERYSAAVVYVSVERKNGDQRIGSAFHVGEGVFLTARHVVEDSEILTISNTTYQRLPDPLGESIDGSTGERFRSISPSKGRLLREPLYHPDPLVDVAALVVDGIRCPPVPLGSHLDDWLNDESFILAQVVVMGYPPVPQSREPLLITTRAEVNAIVDKYSGPHPHFVLSAMARGGFSGGPVIVEWGFALGLVTESLVDGEQVAEVGYMSAVSVEPLFTCLEHHRILPAAQKEGWDGTWAAI